MQNATTEAVLISGGKILGAGRVPTRGRKGSDGSLRGAAALVRRLERQLACAAGETRLAPLRAVSWFYVWFMRGTPVLLQLVFLYDALPAIGIKFDSFTTAVLGFTLNEAAFCAEKCRPQPEFRNA